MPLILSYEESKFYKTCADASITMAMIGYSGQHHLLGIIEGAKRFFKILGLSSFR